MVAAARAAREAVKIDCFRDEETREAHQVERDAFSAASAARKAADRAARAAKNEGWRRSSKSGQSSRPRAAQHHA